VDGSDVGQCDSTAMKAGFDGAKRSVNRIATMAAIGSS
jgi:hypothetical protein